MSEICSLAKKMRCLALVLVFLAAGCASGQVTELGGVGYHQADDQTAENTLTAEEVKALHAENAYGTVLNCAVVGGTAVFKEGWDDYNPEEFKIVRAERKVIKLSHAAMEGMNTRFQVVYDRTGQKLSFCEILRPSKFGSFLSLGEDFDIDFVDNIKLGAMKTGKCVSIYALPEDYDPGIQRTLDVPNTVRGATLLCSYRDPSTIQTTQPQSGYASPNR